MRKMWQRLGVFAVTSTLTPILGLSAFGLLALGTRPVRAQLFDLFNMEEKVAAYLQENADFYPDAIRTSQTPPDTCMVGMYGWPLSFSFASAPWWMTRRDFEQTFLPELAACGIETVNDGDRLIAKGIPANAEGDIYDVVFTFSPMMRSELQETSLRGGCRSSARPTSWRSGECRLIHDRTIFGLSRFDIQGPIAQAWTAAVQATEPDVRQETRSAIVNQQMGMGPGGMPIAVGGQVGQVPVGPPYHRVGHTRVVVEQLGRGRDGGSFHRQNGIPEVQVARGHLYLPNLPYRLR